MKPQQMFSRKDVEQTFQRIEEDIQRDIAETEDKLSMCLSYDEPDYSSAGIYTFQISALTKALRTVESWKPTLLARLVHTKNGGK